MYYFSFPCSLQFHAQAKDFIKCVSGSSSLYGLKSDTLESLVLTLLPPLGHKYITLGEPSVVDSTVDVRVYLVQELLQSLRHCAGFHIPPVSIKCVYMCMLEPASIIYYSKGVIVHVVINCLFK